jgi:hypothetical protein
MRAHPVRFPALRGSGGCLSNHLLLLNINMYVLTIASVIVVFVAVAPRRRPVGSITSFCLALITGAWVWANLRDSGWQELFNEDAPEGLDLITRAMFYRGWPLAPVMICLVHGMRFRPNGLEGLTLVFDCLVLFLVLCLARFVSERCSHRRDGCQRIADSLRNETAEHNALMASFFESRKASAEIEDEYADIYAKLNIPHPKGPLNSTHLAPADRLVDVPMTIGRPR